MPSQDILDRLFEVEKKAASLISAARDEAERRSGAIREETETARAAAHESRARELEAEFGEARRAIEGEFSAELAAYRARLEASPLDAEAFRGEAARLLGLGA